MDILQLYDLVTDLKSFNGQSKDCCGCKCHTKSQDPPRYETIHFPLKKVDFSDVVPMDAEEEEYEPTRMVLRSDCKRNGGCMIVFD